MIDIENLNRAYETYNLNIDDNIDSKILEFIEKCLDERKQEITNLLEVNKDNITYEDIVKVFIEEKKKKTEYKKERNFTKIDDKYIFSNYTTSIGLIVIETSNVFDIVRYFVGAIKSRSVVVISSIEYSELDIRLLLQMIFKDCIKKYGVDENIINILPYEECYYENFDRVIVPSKKKIVDKNKTDDIYIYIQDDIFNTEVNYEIESLKKENKKVELIEKIDIDEAIKKINKNVIYGACIYTQNKDLAYKFVNLVHAKNVFVNSTMARAKEIVDLQQELYLSKNIMYPYNI